MLDYKKEKKRKRKKKERMFKNLFMHILIIRQKNTYKNNKYPKLGQLSLNRQCRELQFRENCKEMRMVWTRQVISTYTYLNSNKLNYFYYNLPLIPTIHCTISDTTSIAFLALF